MNCCGDESAFTGRNGRHTVSRSESRVIALGKKQKQCAIIFLGGGKASGWQTLPRTVSCIR